MNRLTLAAGIAALLSLHVLSLQAQNPANPPGNPVFRTEPPTDSDPIPRPVPDSLTPQPATGPVVPPEQPPEFAKYPIWLLIKPDGIQFLQSQEEITVNQNRIPLNAFLLGCVTVDFKGTAGEQKPDFQLNCEDFLLMGRYGTQQNLDVKGASLTFSTKAKQIQLTGTDELPLEFHSVDVASETRMQADEITLQLDSGVKTVTRYEARRYLDAKTGQQKTAQVPITEQKSHGSSFQLTARNITSLEVIANSAPGADAPVYAPYPNPYGNRPPSGDAPKWDPDYHESAPPKYVDPSGGFNAAPTPAEGNKAVPYYDNSEESEKSRKFEDPGFKPSPAPEKKPR